SERSGLPESFMQQELGFEYTADVTAKGMEFSLDYNPVRNWNIKLTAARQESINDNVAPATQRWLWGADGEPFAPAAGSRLDYYQSAQFRSEAAEYADTPWANRPMVDWWTTD